MAQISTELKKDPISNIAQVGVIMHYTILDYVRSRRFIILLLMVAGISGILIGIFGKIMYLWGEMSLMITILSGILFGSDSIAGEFQNKTVYFSVPNPIQKISIYLGKWLAAFFASTIIMCVYAVITWVDSLVYSNLPANFGLSVLIEWFFLAAVLGCVFFFSALTKNIMISVFLSLLFLVMANTIIVELAGYIPYEPWFALSYGGMIIGDVLINPYPPQVHIGPNIYYPKIGGLLTTLYNPTIPEGLIIIGIYFIVSMILGMILFQKKEF